MSKTTSHDDDMLATLAEAPTSRRAFLRTASLTAVGGALVACAKEGSSTDTAVAKAAPSTPAGTPTLHSAQSGGTMGAHDTAKPAAGALSAADAMDAMHEKGIKAFPAKTSVYGNQLLEPKLVDGVKVYELTATEMQWETEPGKMVSAMAYNGQVPGPQIRVREGDRVRVVLKNQLKESTAIHFHGLEVPVDQDGVPFITQPPVKPGASYTYEFTVPNAGSHMYHSHHNSAVQVGLGLLGAFIVEPKDKAKEPKVDQDVVFILNDGAHGYTFNGKSFPATQPIVAKLGQKVRIRYMNEGMMIHPMHLHGMHQTVIAKDGWDQPAPWKCDTLNIAPGERWDVIVNCVNPGTWAFHCHILPHAEAQHGMFGMVTALVVEK
ncbi:MAG TPA: copper oxidase [Gemmatimonadaceae bacterium]|nr:copper oxidase [Gemmatimonadaceae bacterium]